MSVSGMMTASVTVQRKTVVQDASGGPSEQWADRSDAVDIPADIQPASSQIRIQYQQRNLNVSHSIYLDADASVRLRDRLVQGSRVFIVLGYLDASAGRGQCWRIDCEEQLR